MPMKNPFLGEGANAVSFGSPFRGLAG